MSSSKSRVCCVSQPEPTSNVAKTQPKPARNLGQHAALFGAIVIAAGFLPLPLVDPSLPPATWLEYSISLLPLVPLLALTLSLVTSRRLPRVTAWVLVGAIAVLGGLLTVFLAAFSGGGSLMITAHGISLLIACGTTVVVVSTCGRRARTTAHVFFILPVVAGLWSLAMIPTAYINAAALSAKKHYCIAENTARKRALGSLANLRGFSFYTTSSGYRLGDQWYFHALLLTEDKNDLEAYNWSPRRMQFQKLKNPRLMMISPFSACTPRAKFLEELPII